MKVISTATKQKNRESSPALSFQVFANFIYALVVSANGQMLVRLSHVILPLLCYLGDNLPFALILHILL